MTLLFATIKVKIWLLEKAGIKLPDMESLSQMFEGDTPDIKLAQTFFEAKAPKNFFEPIKLCVEFSGGGDSGDFTGSYLDVDLKKTEIQKRYPFLVTPRFVHRSCIYLHPLNCPVAVTDGEDLYDLTAAWDWYNNDGGHGVIEVNLATLEVETIWHLAERTYTTRRQITNLTERYDTN